MTFKDPPDDAGVSVTDIALPTPMLFAFLLPIAGLLVVMCVYFSAMVAVPFAGDDALAFARSLAIVRINLVLLAALTLLLIGTMLISAVFVGARISNGLWGVVTENQQLLLPGTITLLAAALLFAVGLTINLNTGSIEPTATERQSDTPKLLQPQKPSP